MRRCVYVCHESDKRERRRKKKTTYDSKTKNNRPREVLILTLILLPRLHLDGQKFTGYKFTNTKQYCFFFYQEMLKYH